MSDNKKPSDRIWQVYPDHTARLDPMKLGELLDEFDARLAKLEAARNAEREALPERTERGE